SHPTVDKLVVTPEAGYAFDSWSYTTTKDDGSVVTATTTDPSSVAILGTTVFKPVFKYVGIPDVVMNKTVATPSGDGTAQPGEIVTYKLTITNNGDGTSKGIWVKDLIPDNTTYLTADSDGTSATDAKSGKQYITWYLADGLAAGASKTLTFTALVGTCADGTSVDNVAYYEETATKPDPDDTSALPKTASNKATFTVSVPATPAASADSTASTSTPTGSTTTATTTNNALAQTGDSFSIAGIVGLMIASLIAAGYVLYRRRRQE
ncbi:MAG: DUF11 domain-containing protein, partial [Eggerthellaceae bacterium]|nr:DUF11 domain-containing protein [Eggerthellaceae bacterium]